MMYASATAGRLITALPAIPSWRSIASESAWFSLQPSVMMATRRGRGAAGVTGAGAGGCGPMVALRAESRASYSTRSGTPRAPR